MIAALVIAAALSAQTETAADADRRMADLQLLYAQSCEVRAYATFDRMCEGLKRQMREAAKTHRQAARAKPKVEAKPGPGLSQTAEAAPPATAGD